MTTQSNRALTSVRSGSGLVSGFWLRSTVRLSRFGLLARKKALNYLRDLPLFISVGLARYMLWREVRRQRRLP